MLLLFPLLFLLFFNALSAAVAAAISADSGVVSASASIAVSSAPTVDSPLSDAISTDSGAFSVVVPANSVADCAVVSITVPDDFCCFCC